MGASVTNIQKIVQTYDFKSGIHLKKWDQFPSTPLWTAVHRLWPRLAAGGGNKK